MKLERGQIYYDVINREEVEFGYMGAEGHAIVYEPGDSGGGMQSSWGINPANLVKLEKGQKICPKCKGKGLI
jgi:hypothetical protein